MAHFAEVHHDQHAHPPPPPMVPMATTQHHHLEQIQRALDNTHLHPNADHFDEWPVEDQHNAGRHNFVSQKVPGGVQRTQSLSMPAKKSRSQNGSHRMYEFKKCPIPGRKPDWEVAERTWLYSLESDLIARVKKPSKDKRTGRSNARDIDSKEVQGNRGFKRSQIEQLLADLSYDDPSSEWRHELIELLDRVRDDESGNLNYDKMIVIVKRKKRQAYSVPRPPVFDLGKAVVDLRQQVRPDAREHLHEDRVQQVAQAHRKGGAARPTQYPGPSQHAGPSQHVGLSQQVGPSQRAGPSQQAGPSHHAGPSQHTGPSQHAGASSQQHAHIDHDARARSAHKAQGVFEHRHQGLDDDIDRTKMNKTEKKDKNDKMKPKSTRIVQLNRPMPDHFDSDSSSDRDSGSDVRTYRTSDTEVSFDSPPGSPRFKQLFSEKGKRKDQKHMPEASREHHRKNPIEYVPESRGRSAREDVRVEPASRDRRHSPAYPRESSFHRNRPSRRLSDDFDDNDYLRIYDHSPERSRLSVHGRPRLTQRLDVREDFEAERERELRRHAEVENLMLRHDLRKLELREAEIRAQQRYERMPRYYDEHRALH